MNPEPTSPTPPATAPGRARVDVGPRPPRLQRILAYRLFWIVALVVYALDQLTKGWIVAQLEYPTYGPPFHIPVIPGFFNLVHVGNTGAAWSVFSGYGHWLALLALATLLAIFLWRRALGLAHRLPQLCFGLLCGGTVGNLTDRLRYGHVIDFLDFHFGDYIYPSFNVADMGIVCGVALYVIWSLKQPAEPAGQ